jgi:hypothetical protein
VFSLIFIEIMLETNFELFSIIRNQEGGCVYVLDGAVVFVWILTNFSPFFFRFLKFFFHDCYCFYLMAQKFQKCFLMDVLFIIWWNLFLTEIFCHLSSLSLSLCVMENNLKTCACKCF